MFVVQDTGLVDENNFTKIESNLVQVVEDGPLLVCRSLQSFRPLQEQLGPSPGVFGQSCLHLTSKFLKN